jgi:hypothetical protein
VFLIPKVHRGEKVSNVVPSETTLCDMKLKVTLGKFCEVGD